jgi:two-component system response regulator FixJ
LFQVRLPLAERSGRRGGTTPPSRLEAAAAGGGDKLMSKQRNRLRRRRRQAMRSSLKWLIESMGMQVETFDSAQAFLDAYYPGRAGCLLLDVRMPGMSGLELQAYLARREQRIPVIIITGHGDVSMAVKAMKNGAVDFIEKPFDDEAADRQHPQRPAARREAACAARAARRYRRAHGGADPA